MIPATQQRDLAVLVPDKHWKFAMQGLLALPKRLKIRPISFEIVTHPAQDSGCRSDAHSYLRSFSNRFRHALVILDMEGCGREHRMRREQIENEIKGQLFRNGWDNRAEAIVVEPELEIWVWNDASVVAQTLGWPNNMQLRKFIQAAGIWEPDRAKPIRPKEAMEQALKEKHISKSAILFEKIAREADIMQCEDLSFRKLLSTLQAWFPTQ
ncbi:MAG: hypothetical protein NTX50_30295 [Candidatus Sumerlaeota bacterium]|nr:hypothetical protein [Candidatus Sumerlaeota bacterium]